MESKHPPLIFCSQAGQREDGHFVFVDKIEVPNLTAPERINKYTLAQYHAHSPQTLPSSRATIEQEHSVLYNLHHRKSEPKKLPVQKSAGLVRTQTTHNASLSSLEAHCGHNRGSCAYPGSKNTAHPACAVVAQCAGT